MSIFSQCLFLCLLSDSSLVYLISTSRFILIKCFFLVCRFVPCPDWFDPCLNSLTYIQSHLSPCEIVLSLFPTPYANLLPPHGEKSISASHKSFWFGVLFRDSVIYSEGWVWKCFWGTEKESCWELHCQGKAFIGDRVWSKADNIVSDVKHSLASSIYSSFCEFLFSSSIPWTLCYWFLIKSQIKTHIFVHFTHLLCTELNNGSVQNLPCVCSRVEIWLEHTNHIILIKPFCYHLFPMNVILEEITLISIKRIGFPLT